MMPHIKQRKKASTSSSSWSSSTSSSSSSTASTFSSAPPLPTAPTKVNEICLCCNHPTKLLPFCDHRCQPISCFSISPRSWIKLKLWFGSSPPMASYTDSPVHAPFRPRKKKFTVQQRKEELEREVSALHEMLAQEQKVHEYLERLHNRPVGSPIVIPTFLPPEMKDMIAELSMAENEIAKLETHVNQLSDKVKHEKEANIETQYNERCRGARKSSPLPPNPNNDSTMPNQEVAFENKALHFISKAMNRDYYLSDFSVNGRSTNFNRKVSIVTT